MRRSGLTTWTAVTIVVIALLMSAIVALVVYLRPGEKTSSSEKNTHPSTKLPEANKKGSMPLEQALATRRSVRAYKDTALSHEQIGQLCWAGQGITDEKSGHRTAPSAGAKYPLTLFVLNSDGCFEYIPQQHALRKVRDEDVREKLPAAAYDQPELAQGPCLVVVAMNPAVTAEKYGSRAERFCFMESGHAAQNILLEAVSLGLGAVPIGGFDDEKVAKVLDLPGKNQAVYLIPVGYPDAK